MLTNFKLSDHFDILPKNGRVLVAPLNWGIGHATRCIPIIKQLQENGFTPIIASDGEALKLLQKVFPKITSYVLPSYQVKYARNAGFFTLKLLSQIPKFIRVYRQEQKRITELVDAEKIDAIISDNRFGIFHNSVKSIYITHQLKVKSGIFTSLSSKIHKRLLQNFDICWVPDVQDKRNLSGVLSHSVKPSIPVAYIGVLSPLRKQKLPIKYEVLVLLSGPEPQRSLLEKKLLKALKNSNKKICFIKGIIEKNQQKEVYKNLTIYNYVLGNDLQRIVNESKLIIARSGYSTIMDLAKLEKKAFFIPTPGQSEQEYLAQHLEKQKIASFNSQHRFCLTDLDRCKDYTGFQ